MVFAVTAAAAAEEAVSAAECVDVAQWAERFWSVISSSCTVARAPESVAIMLGPKSTSVPTKQPA